MFPYIPNTDAEKKAMLDTIKASSVEELFSSVPKHLLVDKLNLPKSKSELEVRKIFNDISSKNKSINELVCFLGAGSYDHYIPSVCKHLSSRAEFYTAYTPYQPEVSQGTLQSIFEYQSMLCSITGMDVSNVSMYDVSTAMAEATTMAVEATRRKKIVVSKTVNPQSRKVVQSYSYYKGYEVVEIDDTEGVSDSDKIKAALDKDVAAVVVQTPNFFGIIEELTEISKMTHDNKSLLILSVDPLSLGVLKTPAEWGADIVVGDCQCFGNRLNFGGPYLGFLNTTNKLVRKLPGRVIGQTEDVDGKRGFVLTLQTREQHIRREKATSNICSDQTLVAINTAMYLSTLGKQGIKEVATQSALKAHYAYNKIVATKGFKPMFDKPFFKEFVVSSDACPNAISDKLLENNIIGGYNISKDYDKYQNALMFAVTEKRTREEIDSLVKVLEVV